MCVCFFRPPGGAGCNGQQRGHLPPKGRLPSSWSSLYPTIALRAAAVAAAVAAVVVAAAAATPALHVRQRYAMILFLASPLVFCVDLTNRFQGPEKLGVVSCCCCLCCCRCLCCCCFARHSWLPRIVLFVCKPIAICLCPVLSCPVLLQAKDCVCPSHMRV